MLRALLVTLALTLPFSALAETEEHTAIEIDIRGGYVGFDSASYENVRALMGAMVTDGSVEHFVTITRGLEGGGTFCLELAPHSISRLPFLISRFEALRVNLVNTAFSVRSTERCYKPQAL